MPVAGSAEPLEASVSATKGPLDSSEDSIGAMAAADTEPGEALTSVVSAASGDSPSKDAEPSPPEQPALQDKEDGELEEGELGEHDDDDGLIPLDFGDTDLPAVPIVAKVGPCYPSSGGP